MLNKIIWKIDQKNQEKDTIKVCWQGSYKVSSYSILRFQLLKFERKSATGSKT
jgi:hypothetical protein